MQIQKHALTVYRTAKCDPDKKVRYKLRALTAIIRQQFSADNIREVEVDEDGKATSLPINFGDYTDQLARYATIEIDGLMDGKKPFKLVKDTVDEFGMKTKVRDGSWAKVPEALKSEIYKVMHEISDLSKKEIESLGFTVLSPGEDWNSALGAKGKR